jgi:hypothetical protein
LIEDGWMDELIEGIDGDDRVNGTFESKAETST